MGGRERGSRVGRGQAGKESAESTEGTGSPRRGGAWRRKRKGRGQRGGGGQRKGCREGDAGGGSAALGASAPGEKKGFPAAASVGMRGSGVSPKSCCEEAPRKPPGSPQGIPGRLGHPCLPCVGQQSEGGFPASSLLRKDPSGCPEPAGQPTVQDLVAGALAVRWA